MKKVLIRFIKKYQQGYDWRGKVACRFTPTCSQYAIEAIEKYGCFKGIIKTIGRLCRCRPPYGGYDPV